MRAPPPPMGVIAECDQGAASILGDRPHEANTAGKYRAVSRISDQFTSAICGADDITSAVTDSTTMEVTSQQLIERAYRMRVYPTRAQVRVLSRLFGASRFVWNWALARRSSAYR